MSDAAEVGPSIHERRNRLGMTAVALAQEAGVDRGRLAKLERGDPSVRQTTVGAVLSALDRLEREAGAPPMQPAEVAQVGERTVKVTVRGNFGVEMDIEGAPSDVGPLAERLAAQLSKGQTPDTAAVPEVDPDVYDAIRKGVKLPPRKTPQDPGLDQ